MTTSRPLGREVISETASASDLRQWFERHITLDGSPYTLDLDQAKAVLDTHKNALIIARAGSGKTRVIVAKIAYLVATRRAHLSEIVAFMFNRTAAAEVNSRIAAVKVDGQPLPFYDNPSAPSDAITVASTFHKYALDIVKISGARPDILTEERHAQVINAAFNQALDALRLKLVPRDRLEYLKLSSSFIARAGQKYPGKIGFSTLKSAVDSYIVAASSDQSLRREVEIHRVALVTYYYYLQSLTGNLIDFNLLMHQATEIIAKNASTTGSSVYAQIAPLKYILIDEYQDFSYLFFALVQSMRSICPDAHLFAVGDDWQAINRFAGSDVNYFISFFDYFPEDCIKIPLMTNYRSARAIVENANDYMLKNYDTNASRAVAFSREAGKIYRLNLTKTKFNLGDIDEDALGDGRFFYALFGNSETKPNLRLLPILKLFKTVYKLIKKHRHSEIMLLHRHNFLSTDAFPLGVFMDALGNLLEKDAIMSRADFNRQIRCMTMHKSKGLESEIVILLEVDRDIVLSEHPHARLFTIFGDNAKNEKSDQHRLLYVALTRAKKRLYILSKDRNSIA